MTPTEALARALVNSDLVARYNQYARKANPKTLYWESDDAIAQGWAPLVAAALRDLGYELRPNEQAAEAPDREAACPGCKGRRWIEDENWSPDDPATWRGERTHGNGLIPCGFCNEGGWTTPDFVPSAAVAPLDVGALAAALRAIHGDVIPLPNRPTPAEWAAIIADWYESDV